MELVAIRLLDHQRVLEEALPLAGQLPLDQVGQDEELLVFGALYLQIRHLLFRCQELVVHSQDEGSLRLKEPLDEFKVHDVVYLYILNLYQVFVFELLQSLLVDIICCFLASYLKFVLNIRP